MSVGIAAEFAISTEQVIDYVLNEQEIILNEEQIALGHGEEDIKQAILRMWHQTAALHWSRIGVNYNDDNSLLSELYMVKSLFGDNVLLDTICYTHGLPYEPLNSPLCLYDEFYGINDLESFNENLDWPEYYNGDEDDDDFPIYGRLPARVEEINGIPVIVTITLDDDIVTILRNAPLPDDGLRRVYANYLNSLDVEEEWPAMTSPAI